MRVLGFLVVAIFMILGAIGLFAPQRLFALAQFATTPTGVYVLAGFRLGVGLILLGVASRSRFPTILRVLGLLVIVGAFATLALGSDRARMIVDWISNQGTLLLRGLGVFALALGSFLTYALAGRPLMKRG